MNRHPLSRAIRRAVQSWSCAALPVTLLLTPPAVAVPDESGCEADRPYRACFLGPAGRRNNPIGLPVDASAYSAPAFADFDADGDLDMLLGATNRQIHLYINEGSAQKPVFYDSAASIDLGSNTNSPIVTDLDGDGDVDVLVRLDGGTLKYFKNIGTPQVAGFEEQSGADNPWGGVHGGKYGAPALADLDADGDLDLVVGNRYDASRYFENTGSAIRPVYIERIGADNPWDWVDEGNYSALADLDADGDLDLLMKSRSILRYFENTGSATQPEYIERRGTDNPWDEVDVSDYYAAPVLADLDADGDLDLVIGDKGGILRYFENTSSAARPVYVERSGADNPWYSANMGNSIAPTLADLDADGDLDLVVGGNGASHYFENTGSAARPMYIGRTATDNPWDGVDVGSTPALADLDADGDLDLAMGSHTGTLHYFENTGNAARPVYIERTDTDNLWDGVVLDQYSKPALADLDADGDFDLAAGAGDGTLHYFENTGSAARPVYVERSGADNPWDGVDVGNNSAPVLADLDVDGDLDLVAGTKAGTLRYFENTGSTIRAVYVQRTGADNPWGGVDVDVSSGPALADLDADGDLDLVVGDRGEDPVAYGKLHYFENTGNVARPMYVERTAADNPLDGVKTEGLFTPPLVDLVDLDADGDLDLVTGVHDGTLHYFENTGSVAWPMYVERSGMDNPWDGVDVDFSSTSAALADLDADGDFDLVAGNTEGTLRYFENIGSAARAVYVERSNVDNPWDGVSVDFGSASTLDDLDADGDLDMVVGGKEGSLHYFENIAPRPLPPVYALPPAGVYPSSRLITLNCLDCTNLVYRVDDDEEQQQTYSKPFTLEHSATLHYAAQDAQGQIGEWFSTYYHIDKQPPVVDIPAATAGSYALDSLPVIPGIATDAGGSSLQRVELQISNGPFYLDTEDGITLTPKLTWLPAQKPPLQKESGGIHSTSWEYADLDGLPLPLGTYTLTVRAFDYAGNVGSKEWTIYNLEQAHTELFLQVSSNTLLNDDILEVKGKLTRLPDSDMDLSGLDVELYIIAPDGTLRIEREKTQSATGQFEFLDLGGFKQEGTYTLQAAFAGNPLLAPADPVQQQRVLVGESAGYALIMQGRVDSREGLKPHRKTANRIYRTLLERGFLPENLYYYAYDTGTALDDAAPVRGTPAREVLNQALEEIQASLNRAPAPFYLVLVDHGGPGGTFFLDGDNEQFNPEELAAWLDGFEAGLSDRARAKTRTVLVGACYSGHYIAALAKPGSNRVIISSAAPGEVSYKGLDEPDGIRSGSLFLEDLFQHLKRGDSFKEAFEKAVRLTATATRSGKRLANAATPFADDALQHPLLDDDGDGKGTNRLLRDGDGARTADLYLGAGLDLDAKPELQDKADIVRVANTVFLGPEETGAELWLVVNNADDAVEVVADIRHPNTEREADISGRTEQKSIEDLYRVPGNLVCGGSEEGDRNRCSKRVEGFFDTAGLYEVFYFVRDRVTENISPIKRSLVYKNYAANPPPDVFNLLVPADGEEKAFIAPYFFWTPAIDPEQQAVTYTLEIFDADGVLVHREEELRQPRFKLENDTLLSNGDSGLKNLSTYTWRVKAVDEYGAMRESGMPRQFSTKDPNPLCRLVSCGTTSVESCTLHLSGIQVQDAGKTQVQGAGQAYDVILNYQEGSSYRLSSKNIWETDTPGGSVFVPQEAAVYVENGGKLFNNNKSAGCFRGKLHQEGLQIAADGTLYYNFWAETF
ncbi:MAG: hypothetical protein GY862_15660 [Gammaproteobacteria bacterium]|nr:hypothetical protein [Gammaproteobacteria bacterium]